jgi:hypothetical protein
MIQKMDLIIGIVYSAMRQIRRRESIFWGYLENP